MNVMQKIRIEKVTLNIGAGKDQRKLDNGVKLLKSITGIDPVKTVTQKRIAAWNLRPGLPIGCKITLRGEKAIEILKRLLEAKSHELAESHISNNGNISFGIREYIDIPGTQYDPSIGVMGLEACVTIERPGYRIKKRKIKKTKVGKKHSVTRDDAIAFMKEQFNVKVGEAE